MYSAAKGKQERWSISEMGVVRCNEEPAIRGTDATKT